MVTVAAAAAARQLPASRQGRNINDTLQHVILSSEDLDSYVISYPCRCHRRVRCLQVKYQPVNTGTLETAHTEGCDSSGLRVAASLLLTGATVFGADVDGGLILYLIMNSSSTKL